MDVSTRVRELTHETRVRNLRTFVLDKKEAAAANKEKLNETRALSQAMEDAAIALLKSQNYVLPTHTKPVCPAFIRCIFFRLKVIFYVTVIGTVVC